MQFLFDLRLQLLALLFCATLLVMLFRLIIKKRLREEYIIIWLFLFVFLLFFAIFRAPIDQLANWVGIYYAPSLLFLALIAVLIIFCLHLSVALSQQSDKVKELAQKIALMEEEHKLK